MGDVEDTGGVVRHHQPTGRDGIDGAGGNPGYEEADEFIHAYSPWREWLWCVLTGDALVAGRVETAGTADET